MKVKEDEMHWVLKNGKKPGLKDLAEQDIIHSDEDTESQLQDDQSVTVDESVINNDSSDQNLLKLSKNLMKVVT